MSELNAKSPTSSDLAVPATLDFSSSVVVLVTVLANRITATGTMIFKERHGLGSAEWKVLAAIAVEPGLSGARITGLVGLDRALVSRILKTFASRGLIDIQQNERHSNYQTICLSSEGAALHNEAIQTAFERENILLSVVSANERQILVKLLRRLIDRAGALASISSK